MSMQGYQRDRDLKIAFKDAVDPVLQTHGLNVTVDITKIHVREKFYVEWLGTRDLSEAIFDHMFPRQNQAMRLDHYTSANGFLGLLNSGELWLHTMAKRLGQGELEEFARFHGLFGYLDVGLNGPVYGELANDLFYTSFTTGTNSNKPYLWSVFASAETGVRLEFEVAGKRADLRKIDYNLPQTTILRDINRALASAGLNPFTPWGISRLGAFYLPTTLMVEEEVRLLLKRWERLEPGPVGTPPNAYWAVPINQPTHLADVKLVGITYGPKANVPPLSAALQGSQFASVSASQAASNKV